MPGDDRRVVVGAAVALVVGLLASPRATLAIGALALALGCVLVATVDRGELGPLRVGDIAIGTTIALGGSAARTRRDGRHTEELLRHEAETVRLRVVEEEHRRLFDELQSALVPPLPALTGTSGDVVIACGGHPPPLVVRADGRAAYVDARRAVHRLPARRPDQDRHGAARPR